MNAADLTPAFAQFSADLPAAARKALEQNLQRFLAQGLPHRKMEDWRYTDLSALASRAFALPAPATPDLSAYALAKTELHSFINGGNGAITAIPVDGSSVVSLNAAFGRTGLNLHLAANQKTAQPVHVLTHVDSAQPVMAHLRHRIRLDENAEATVILHHGGRGEYLTTQVTEIELAAGARLTLYRVQDESAGSTHLAQTDVRMGRESRLKFVNVDLGSGLARQDFNVNLAEPGAEAGLYGLYAPSGKAHVDNHTRVHHQAPRCTSREFFRGVIGGSSRAVFNGKVVVHEGAIKTDSETRVANLLLSKTAEVYAKPDLEIYNDDVKCAHGATFGQLDEDALYYLRARGLDKNTASAMLTQAFAQEVLNHIRHDALHEYVTQRFLERLPSSLPSGEPQSGALQE
ncbi:MAG: Fe-S cluster assembly protein SufD [Stenotrophobium sp.]